MRRVLHPTEATSCDDDADEGAGLRATADVGEDGSEPKEGWEPFIGTAGEVTPFVGFWAWAPGAAVHGMVCCQLSLAITMDVSLFRAFCCCRYSSVSDRLRAVLF